MRKVIYHADSITESDSVVSLGDSDFIPGAREPQLDEDYILDGDTPEEAVAARPVPQPEESDSDADTDAPSRSRRVDISPEIEQLKEMGRLIIEQATAEASRIIEAGHTRAQTEYAEAMAKAHSQITKEREAARAAGHSEALKMHSDNIARCIRGIEDALCRIESAQAAFITGYENDLKWLAVEIAEKILSDTIEADQTRLVPLVMAAVRSAKAASWLSVEISEEMVELFSALQEEIKSGELDDAVSIKLSPLPPGGCIVETTDKFIDASISQQIENLKDYFRTELH